MWRNYILFSMIWSTVHLFKLLQYSKETSFKQKQRFLTNCIFGSHLFDKYTWLLFQSCVKQYFSAKLKFLLKLLQISKKYRWWSSNLNFNFNFTTVNKERVKKIKQNTKKCIFELLKIKCNKYDITKVEDSRCWRQKWKTIQRKES